MQVCGVWRTKKAGSRCLRKPDGGRARCRNHGGLRKRGAANKRYKGRGYSLDLPTRLVERYEQAVRDPELLSCRHEVALLHARVAELARRLHRGESGSLWKKLLETYYALEEAMRAKDIEKIGKLLTAVGKTIKQGAKDERVWSELIGTIDAKTRLSDREVNRLRLTQQIITAEQAMTLVAALAMAVRRAVPEDTELQRKIGRNMQQVLEYRGADALINANAVVAAQAAGGEAIDAKSEPAGKPQDGEQSQP